MNPEQVWKDNFTFMDPGELVDDDLELVLVRRYPGDPEKAHVPEYIFEMRHTGCAEIIGEIRLRIGALPDYIGHLTYSVLPEHRGRRYAARSCRLVASLARRHGMDEMVITCLPDNVASRRTCELAGAEFAGIVKVPSEGVDAYHRNVDCKCRYILKV